MTVRPKRSRAAASKRPKADATETSGAERLQKVLAAAGVASRRECEQLIREGRVEVDRQVVTKLGTKVDPASQDIRVDGTALSGGTRNVYYAVNKPTGVLSTSHDPSGRPRVIDLAPSAPGRVFAVGRLDKESEGLILVTNDGELANRLTHPRYGIQKTYHVQVAGSPEAAVLKKLRDGVRLADSVVHASSVRIKRRHKQSTIVEIVLAEGRNREIRRMLAALGHKVQRLRRVAIGPLKIGQLIPGESRPLTRQEVSALRKATGLASSRRGGGGRRR